MISKELMICLPENYKWKEGKVIRSSPSLEVDGEIKGESKFIINFGLFRCGEFLQFEALFEAPTKDIKSLRNNLKFQHRIANTSKLGNVSLKDISQGWVNVLAPFLMASAMFLGFLYLTFHSINDYMISKSSQVYYAIPMPDGKKIDVEIKNLS
jgi:hypothetical protein